MKEKFKMEVITMKAFVKKDVCIGCELCTTIAPDVFRMTDEGVSEAYSEGKDALVKEAIESCPVFAIEEA